MYNDYPPHPLTTVTYSRKRRPLAQQSNTSQDQQQCPLFTDGHQTDLSCGQSQQKTNGRKPRQNRRKVIKSKSQQDEEARLRFEVLWEKLKKEKEELDAFELKVESPSPQRPQHNWIRGQLPVLTNQFKNLNIIYETDKEQSANVHTKNLHDFGNNVGKYSYSTRNAAANDQCKITTGQMQIPFGSSQTQTCQPYALQRYQQQQQITSHSSLNKLSGDRRQTLQAQQFSQYNSDDNIDQISGYQQQEQRTQYDIFSGRVNSSGYQNQICGHNSLQVAEQQSSSQYQSYNSQVQRSFNQTVSQNQCMNNNRCSLPDFEQNINLQQHSQQVQHKLPDVNHSNQKSFSGLEQETSSQQKFSVFQEQYTNLQNFENENSSIINRNNSIDFGRNTYSQQRLKSFQIQQNFPDVSAQDYRNYQQQEQQQEDFNNENHNEKDRTFLQTPITKKVLPTCSGAISRSVGLNQKQYQDQASNILGVYSVENQNAQIYQNQQQQQLQHWDTYLQQLLSLSLQQRDQILPMDEWVQKQTKNTAQLQKVGEGSFADVYRFGESKVVKIIPFDTTQGQKLVTEVVIAQALTNLRDPGPYSVEHFIQCIGVSITRGPYSNSLLSAWNQFAKNHTTENENPEEFEEAMLYVALSCEYGGEDLEQFQVNDFIEAKTILFQVCLALAVAERSHNFEHRDLHSGNLLIQRSSSHSIGQFHMDGVSRLYKKFGLHVNLIDFTLSRLRIGSSVVFYDLAADPDIFRGPKGDEQCETYRRMKKLVKGNSWGDFYPQTNCLWMYYLADLFEMKAGRACRAGTAAKLNQLGKKLISMDVQQRGELRSFRNDCLKSKNCQELIGHQFFEECMVDM